MKEWIKRLWNDPVKRMLVSSFGFGMCTVLAIITYLFDKNGNILVSILLTYLTLFFIILGSTPYIIYEFKIIWQDIQAFIDRSKGEALYEDYQQRNKHKSYKGPQWEDEKFQRVNNLEERINVFVQVSIEYQKADFEQWKKKNLDINLATTRQTMYRSFWVLCAGTLSIIILGSLGWLNYLSADNLKELGDSSRGFFTIPVALIGTIIAAPVIFVVWIFRDKNNRIQLENARKDTNLKDFQKLSEWASGFHLPEIKKASSTKKTIKRKSGEAKEFISETLTTIEDLASPSGSTNISRRQGAEALQASAIAQLEAFMLGKYGEQFMKPAFLLLHSIWETILSQEQADLSDPTDFLEHLRDMLKMPVISALNRALIQGGGAHLLLFKDALAGLNLMGLNKNHPSVKALNLANCSLIGTNLSYVNFSSSNLVNVDLTKAVLQDANFKACNLQKSSFWRAWMHQIKLSHANLQGAYLSSAKLRYADLWGANLQLANLSGSELHGANLQAAILIDTKLEYAKIDRHTQFGDDNNFENGDTIREDILSRGAIWDDDPEWLVGKIQDAALLEKIRQDCAKRAERAKQKGA